MHDHFFADQFCDGCFGGLLCSACDFGADRVCFLDVDIIDTGTFSDIFTLLDDLLAHSSTGWRSDYFEDYCRCP